MRHGPTNVAQDGTERRASPRPTGPHAVAHPLPPRLIIFSHPHIPTQTPHTHRKFLLVPLFPPPLCIHTQGNGTSCHDVIFVSFSRPLSFLVLSLPRPPVGPSIHASLEYVIHTHTSLGPAKYINYTFTHVLHHVPHWSKKPSLHIYFAYNIPFE